MKKFKGFTLLELIIVMAILAILMTAIIQMMKPIRNTYVDSTLFENQRNTQNGIVRYITESVRFSTDLGLYSKDQVSNAAGALSEFTKAYMTANGADPSDTTLYNSVYDKMKENAEIIIIDNSEYTYRNRTYTGRLIRRKNAGTAVLDTTEPEAGELTKAPVRDHWRLALGDAYYGDSSYTITLADGDTTNTDWTAADGIKVTVASRPTSMSKNRANLDNNIADRTVANNGLILCKNQSDPDINGMFDTAKFTAGTNAPGTKIYIVYINNKVAIS